MSRHHVDIQAMSFNINNLESHRFNSFRVSNGEDNKDQNYWPFVSGIHSGILHRPIMQKAFISWLYHITVSYVRVLRWYYQSRNKHCSRRQLHNLVEFRLNASCNYAPCSFIEQLVETNKYQNNHHHNCDKLMFRIWIHKQYRVN